MNNNFKWQLPLLVVACSLYFTSCTEPDSVGIEVQPASDQVNLFFTDTISIEVNSIREDSLRSDEGVALFNLAGSYSDPVFGSSGASFYSQIQLPNNNTFFSFGSSPILDSAVLTLAYADFYGDTLTPMTFEVLRLDQNMILDSNYFTNDVINTSDLLFSGQVEIRPKDSVEVSGGDKAPHLRLKMSDAFFTDNFLGSDDILKFADNAAFINFFKGIQVRTQDISSVGSGVIVSFNLQAAMSKMTLYYRNAGGTGLTANFEINSGSPRFNNFKHDYITATFGTFPIDGSNKIYVQSMAGVKARIKFPHISNLGNQGPVSINKAELIIPVEDNATFRNHQNLLVFGVDENGKEALIPDLLESSSYYGGNFSSTDNNYKFNIGRYVQRLLSGKIETDYGLSLISSGGSVNAFRTIIPGPLSPVNKIKLKVTYSKLN